MTRLLLVLVAAFVLAPAAAAGHTYPGDPHWPSTVTAWNGHSHPNPEARWVHVVNRTGFGNTFRTVTLPNALVALQQASGGRFQFSTTHDTMVNLAGGAAPGLALNPVGSIFLGRHNVGSGYTTWQTCAGVSPQPQPYCGTNGSHVTEAVVALGNNDSYMIRHELGHVFGLDHRSEPTSIMAGYCCAFDQHDRDTLAFLYGHTP